ncbi:hypothetical protein VKS41_008072 [Umbelopsis sp. WA50703]
MAVDSILSTTDSATQLAGAIEALCRWLSGKFATQLTRAEEVEVVPLVTVQSARRRELLAIIHFGGWNRNTGWVDTILRDTPSRAAWPAYVENLRIACDGDNVLLPRNLHGWPSESFCGARRTIACWKELAPQGYGTN